MNVGFEMDSLMLVEAEYVVVISYPIMVTKVMNVKYLWGIMLITECIGIRDENSHVS